MLCYNKKGEELMSLHILNGTVMYDVFKNKGFLEKEVIVPFNEAMCYGETTSEIFSDHFIATRCKMHRVKEKEYREHTLKPLQPLLKLNFTSLTLWFDADMFCQMNIITILGWLDFNRYDKPITLYIVDDHYKIKEMYILNVNGYDRLYKQVLVDRMMPDSIEVDLIKKGVERFFSYLNPEGELMKYIDLHQDLSDEELMLQMLDQFPHYGLGDIQCLELIRKKRTRRQSY